MRLPAPLMSAAVLGLAIPLLALPASAATLMTFIGPDSGSATTTCSGDTGPRTGASTVHGLATCFRPDVGTATGEAMAANGHIGATAIADSHNGDSLAAEIAASAGYDDVMTFTSVVPGATTAMASVNLVLDGELLATGPVASSSFDLTLSVAGNDFRANYSLDGSGLHRVIDNFTLEGGQIGPETAASLGTFSFMVPLNQLVRISARLESRAVASGPGSHALAGFVANSLKFAPTPFDLPDGVTVNAGDYIVNNHFIDPLAAPGGVPEPASWALMILAFGLMGGRLRRRPASGAGWRPTLRGRTPSILVATAAASALAASATASTQSTFVGPNSDSATLTCAGEVGPKTGSGVVRQEAVCTGAGVGTAIAGAVAAPGHIGASARADSFNGDSLLAKNGASAIYQDFVTFTSTTPGATTQSIAVNFVLDGSMEIGGPFGSADLILGFSMAGADFGLRMNLNTIGGFSSSQNSFVVEGGSLGAASNARLGTTNIVVPLNSPVLLRFMLETTAVASGPGSLGLIDFGTNSFKFASTPFDLPEGVTANAGDYIVDNRFIDPLAPAVGVPEPAAWALMILGFGLAGGTLRRRRNLLLI